MMAPSAQIPDFTQYIGGEAWNHQAESLLDVDGDDEHCTSRVTQDRTLPKFGHYEQHQYGEIESEGEPHERHQRSVSVQAKVQIL